MTNHVTKVLILQVPDEGYVKGDQFSPVVTEKINDAVRFVLLKDAKAYRKNAQKKLRGMTVNIVPAIETRDQNFRLVSVELEK